MADFASIAKQAQDALGQGADKVETAVKDNADKIESAIDKVGQFAKDKFPDRAAQIDSATTKAKGVVPRHEQTPGDAPVVDTPPDPSATPEVDRTAAEAAGVGDQTTPSSAGFAPPASATPEVDRIAREQG